MLRWKSALSPGGGGSSDGSTPVAAGQPGSACGKGCRGGHDRRLMAQRRSREPRNEKGRGSGGRISPKRLPPSLRSQRAATHGLGCAAGAFPSTTLPRPFRDADARARRLPRHLLVRRLAFRSRPRSEVGNIPAAIANARAFCGRGPLHPEASGRGLPLGPSRQTRRSPRLTELHTRLLRACIDAHQEPSARRNWRRSSRQGHTNEAGPRHTRLGPHPSQNLLQMRAHAFGC